LNQYAQVAAKQQVLKIVTLTGIRIRLEVFLWHFKSAVPDWNSLW